jgi:hypothetical protein
MRAANAEDQANLTSVAELWSDLAFWDVYRCAKHCQMVFLTT